jgi:tellurite resistance protein
LQYALYHKEHTDHYACRNKRKDNDKRDRAAASHVVAFRHSQYHGIYVVGRVLNFLDRDVVKAHVAACRIIGLADGNDQSHVAFDRRREILSILRPAFVGFVQNHAYAVYRIFKEYSGSAA